MFNGQLARSRRVAVLLILPLSLTGPVYAQVKTDVVRLVNGDAITGEVSDLGRGRLEYKTDDAGTIYIEWDRVVSLVAEGWRLCARSERGALWPLYSGKHGCISPHRRLRTSCRKFLSTP
jgi:hypothetical protein